MNLKKFNELLSTTRVINSAYCKFYQSGDDWKEFNKFLKSIGIIHIKRDFYHSWTRDSFIVHIYYLENKGFFLLRFVNKTSSQPQKQIFSYNIKDFVSDSKNILIKEKLDIILK